MTQDRRKDENRPTETLVFTDAALIAAGLAHLEAERAGACLVHAKDDVWVGVGTKDALRGLLSEDTASQSQAVPSELASLEIAAWLRDNGKEATTHASKVYMEGCNFGVWGEVAKQYTIPLVKLSDVQSLFSHSAATGKVPEDERGAFENYVRSACDSEEYANSILEKNTGGFYHTVRIQGAWEGWSARAALASPAAPLAGKAEPVAWIRFRSDGGYEGPIMHAAMEEVRKNSGAWTPLYTAPLAAAVPAEEASENEWKKFDGESWINFGKLVDVLLTNGCYEYARPCNRVDWTQVADWRYAAPAEPAPIQAIALTDEDAKAISRAAECVDSYGRDDLAEKLRSLLARLSKPTAQGTAFRPNADCSGEPSNCPDNEGYGCACGYGAPVAADAAVAPSSEGAVTAPSIDTQEFRELMCHLGYWVDEDDAWNDECGLALVEFINRYIAAQATAGRDARHAVSVKIRDEALEEAALICDRQASDAECPERAIYCADAIRELKSHAAEQASGGAK